MKTLDEHMSVYAAYHRNGVNKAIHFVMVPAIVWSLMVWLDNLLIGTYAGTPVTVAMVFVGAILVWYLLMDFAIGLAATALFTLLMISAIELNNALGAGDAAIVAGIVFVASWVFQFLGHGVWEKRRPALFDNLFQTLVAPSFVIAEVAFGLGLKKDLEAKVQEGMQAHLPGA